MLRSLRIENFALIDALELDFSAGLTVLTGETGAGKSIILDAIDAVLGGKINGSVIRAGAQHALIEATFRMLPGLEAWFQAQSIALPEAETFVCRREIKTTSGSPRSRSAINGMAVKLQQLESLRDRLVELTAQGQTVQLGNPALQREWLDSYGGEPVVQQRAIVAAAYAAYQKAVQTLEKRRKSEQERLQQLDLFEFQLKELRAADLTESDELEELEQERNRLTHSVELQQHSYQVYQALYENDTEGEAAADLLGRAESLLQDMADIDAQLQPILDLVSGALAQVEEAGREINLYGENVEADPQRLQAVQERINLLKGLCKKYGPTLAEAIALRDQLQADLEGLTDEGASLGELERRCDQCHQALLDACAQLTTHRQQTAQDLEERLVRELKPLAMEKVRFTVELVPTKPSAAGADQITFLFSPNPGEPLKPLTAIASGGEMSRFLLALQASFSRIDPVGTLVFDEIDVGVSGRVTTAIAEKLYQLSQNHQVLCVTHQAIVAAMADHHLHVSKQTIDPASPPNGKTPPKGRRKSKATPTAPPPTPGDATIRTVVRVAPLAPPQRREELAQLAGGKTDQEALTFADSLLKQADEIRQKIQPAATPH